MTLRFACFVALRHITVRLRTTLLTLAGVAVGVFVNVVMQSMMLGFQSEFMRVLLTSTPGILVRARPREARDEGRVRLPPAPGADTPRMLVPTRLKPARKERGIRNYTELGARLRALPGVVGLSPLVQGRALLRYGTRERGTTVIAIDPTDYDRVVEFSSKVTGDAGALARGRDGIILGAILAEELGAVIGTRVRLEGGAGDGRQAVTLRVVGLFNSGVTVVDRGTVFTGLRTGQAVLDYPAAVTGFAIKVADISRATPLARQVEYLTGYQTQSWHELNANFFALITQQNVITFTAVALTLLVGGFGIANGLISTVLEKRRDIGILLAMGVTRGGVARIFVLEGVLIGVAGAALGAAAASWAVAVLDNTPLGGRGGISTVDTFVMLRGPLVYCTSAVLALLVSAAASVLPALRAANYDPVEVIRTAR
jgi:lipoprotein-releasing system permease protein